LQRDGSKYERRGNMGELWTIGRVSGAFGVSTRMLRHYEKLGLLQSRRIENYAYRLYDEENCQRLRQIIILRKLRISLKQIALLMENDSAINAIELFMDNINELDGEISSLSTIRDILQKLANKLRENTALSLSIDLLSEESISSLISPAALNKFSVKEIMTMDELDKANETVSKLTDKDVRIVYLPPAEVATYQYEGDEPENHVHAVINKFVRDSGLRKIKPEIRHYGFNSPNPDESGKHGYEIWVTIPNGMDMPEPLVRKQFAGGLYAARMIPFGEFEMWGKLFEWVSGSEKYEYRGEGNNSDMFGCLEESLTYVNRAYLEEPDGDGFQLDLLLPIKERE
jgi:DNA-binding transcriptional MerR regulator/DNA gyrase inhibitor GyrI